MENMTSDEEERMWQDVRDESYADVKIQNPDHECVVCDAPYPCERPTWDDCKCRIYCERCTQRHYQNST